MSKFRVGDKDQPGRAQETIILPDLLANAVFIAQMTDQLHSLASAKKLVKLARILDMIHFEAVMQSCNLKNRINIREV